MFIEVRWAMWSPVFEKMFISDFKEKNSGEIELPGKKASEIKELLQIMYPEGRGTGSQISHLPNFFGHFSLLPNFFARFSLLPNFSPSSQISALISWDTTLQYLDFK